MPKLTQKRWFRWLLSWVNLLEALVDILTFGKVFTMRLSMALLVWGSDWGYKRDGG